MEQPLSLLYLYSIENNYSLTLIGVTAFYRSIQTLPLTINNERQRELVILVLAGRHAHSTEGTLHLTSLFTLKMIFFFIAYITEKEKRKYLLQNAKSLPVKLNLMQRRKCHGKAATLTLLWFYH